MKHVAIIGLGYVGLPLALLADKKGYQTIGVEVNESKVKLLQAGKSPIEDEAIGNDLKKSCIEFTSDMSKITDCNTVVVCVPTPVDETKMPDLTPLISATESLAKHIKEDTLVVIESTINPGVCDDVVIPLLEKTSGLKGGKNVFVAHCPERINPGDTKWNVENISRVVGADSTEGLERALSFYRDILTGEVKPMGSIKEAEAVKVVENSFRDINIAFVNELAMSFQKMGINIENVIDGAATKPFAFMPHHPGCGVGGHCIPVDPYYLIEHARGFGFEHRFLQLAREINEGMPDYTIDLVKKGTEKAGIEKADCQIVVMGQSYKPDVDDARESPAVKILSKLKALGFQAKAYDPHIPGKSDFDSLEDALSYANTLLIATAHSEFKALSPDVLSKNDIHVLIDGRNMFRTNYQEFKHTIYLGIGINA